MKSLLIVLLVAGATLACAGEASSAREIKKSKPAAKSVVTGSHIPVEVDKTGRPVKSTLTVNVVDENAIRLYGFGSPSYVLGKLPMVYSRR